MEAGPLSWISHRLESGVPTCDSAETKGYASTVGYVATSVLEYKDGSSRRSRRRGGYTVDIELALLRLNRPSITADLWAGSTDHATAK